MTPHIQQAETAELNMARQVADYASLETTAPSVESIAFANDNATGRANILTKRRRRRSRLFAR